MKTYILIIATLGLTFLVGCGPGGALLLRPVSITEELEETIVRQDRGWFVSDRVVIVDVDGVLANKRDRDGFGASENPVSVFIEKLDKAAADSRVKAIVLRINSPGGTVAATDMMYDALCKFRARSNIPVVAIIEDVGASGGYYLACGADRIMAHHSSIVGSIGVIMQTFNLAEMLKSVGIATRAITSGAYKDVGSPFKPLTPNDLKLLQGIIDSFYEQFVKEVGKGRPGMAPEQVRALADGRVFTGAQGKANGLVDELGYLDNAIAAAKRLGGAETVKVVIYHRPFGYRANIYSKAASAPQVNVINVSLPGLLDSVGPRFLYLWTGHAGAGR